MLLIHIYPIPVRLPSDDGMGPLMREFGPNQKNQFRAVKLPYDGGIEPVNWLE